MKKILGICCGLVAIIILVIGIEFKSNQNKAIKEIGGVDGPTSFFVAKKVVATDGK